MNLMQFYLPVAYIAAEDHSIVYFDCSLWAETISYIDRDYHNGDLILSASSRYFWDANPKYYQFTWLIFS